MKPWNDKSEQRALEELHPHTNEEATERIYAFTKRHGINGLIDKRGKFLAVKTEAMKDESS